MRAWVAVTDRDWYRFLRRRPDLSCSSCTIPTTPSSEEASSLTPRCCRRAWRGCIILQDPFFFAERDWLPPPANFKAQTVQGKRYDLTQPTGHALCSPCSHGGLACSSPPCQSHLGWRFLSIGESVLYDSDWDRGRSVSS